MNLPDLSTKNWMMLGALGALGTLIIIVIAVSTRSPRTASIEPPAPKPAQYNSAQEVAAATQAIARMDQQTTGPIINTPTQQQNPMVQQQAIQAEQMRQMAMQQAYLRSMNAPVQRPVEQPEAAGEKSFVLSFKDTEDHLASVSPPSHLVESEKPKGESGFACGSEDDYWSACIAEGSVLMATITNSLRGDFTGPVMAQVSQAFMSKDKKHVLVPAGTVVLGESGKVGGQEQSRLEIAFHRMILSDGAAWHHAGWAVSLDKQQGLSVDGSAGQKGDVNHHIPSMIAASAAYGLLAGFSLSGTGSYLNGSGTDMYRQGISQSMGQQGQQQLSRMMNRMPTITVPSGSECNVYISSDLRMK